MPPRENLPFTPTNPDVTVLDLNPEAFAELVTFVDLADQLTIGFVEINFGRDTEVLIEALKQHPNCQQIQFEVLDCADPHLRFLRDEIVNALRQMQVKPDKKLVLIITGLEQAIGMLGDYPPMLQDLNFVRDAFATSVPHPLLFCLPDYALTRLAKFAPDFWAWRSGVFKFKSTAAAQTHALSQTLKSDRIRESLDLPEKQERIDLLLRLLMDHAPSGHTETLANLKSRIEILNELGIAYHSNGEVQKAEDAFQQGLRLTDDSDHLSSIKASVLHHLGRLYSDQGRGKEALALYHQALELFERNGDIQGKVATLHCIAMLEANQGETEKAIALYQQSLDIEEQIGHMQGKAATLHQMAMLKANRGEVEEAIILYQQSLEIKERIGNIQGKVTTLNDLASLKASQGDMEEAIALFKQVLEIEKRIGYVQGEAVTLWWLGSLAEQQGDPVTALPYLQEALEILKRIKSPNTARVQETIARIQQTVS